MEDKQAICDALCKTLNLTRAGSDIKAIWHDNEKEEATVVYQNGYEICINVAADSGIAMMRDILKRL